MTGEGRKAEEKFLCVTVEKKQKQKLWIPIIWIIYTNHQKLGYDEMKPPEQRQAIRGIVRSCTYGSSHALSLCWLSTWTLRQPPLSKPLKSQSHSNWTAAESKCAVFSVMLSSVLAVWELAVTQNTAENDALYTCANDRKNVNLVIISPALTFLCSNRW